MMTDSASAFLMNVFVIGFLFGVLCVAAYIWRE